MSKEMEPFKVVNYALSLNKYWWTMPKAAKVILYYAIGREASKIDVPIYDACRQIGFFYARHPDLLPPDITKFLEQTDLGESIVEQIDYEFDQDAVADELASFANGNPDFANLCREWYQFYLSFLGDSKFKLDFNDDKFSLYLEFRRYYLVSNGIPTSLPRLMLLEWQDKNSIHDVALIAMYSAIRSIIGRKEVAATTRAFIHARMFGARNTAELEAMTQEPKLNECIKEWEPTKHRRKFASLLDDLRGRHLVNYWGDIKTRRIYVSLIADDNAFCIAVADFIKSQKKKKRDVTQTILNLLDVQVK